LDNLYDSYGAPESSQYNIDCVQLARHYKLPCYSTSGVSDTKTPGLQSTVERLFSDILVTLSGPQYLHCAYGLFDGNSTYSPLQTVLDDAHFGMIKFFLRSPDLSPAERETSLKQIREVVLTPQKLYIRHIRPLLRSGRLSMPYPFEDTGEGDEALERANDRMNELLEKPVDHIDEATATKLFDEIPGLLPRLNVYAERKDR
jgi:trimethylamine--corrinoid protein Co-methyltransferase